MKKRMLKCIKLISITLCLVIGALYITRLIPLNKDGVTVSGAEIGDKAIALSFDDGPGKYTEKLLDGLEKYGAKATFFVVGKKAEKYPDTVNRIFSDGHLLGMHTYDHIDMYHNSVKSVKENVKKNEDVLQKVTGEKPLFLRAPYGNVTPVQLKAIENIFVSWSLDSFDWRGKDEEYIFNRLVNKAADGDIVLMHDTKEATVNAVLRAIPELQKRGFRFVRVDELLSRNGNEIKYGIAYRTCRYNKQATAF